jgi:putative transposase
MSDRDIEDQRLLGVIRGSYVASDGVYGARRVLSDLREAGESCSKHQGAKIMHLHKINAIRGDKAPRRIAGRPSIIAPNRLQRKFTVDAPDHAWVTDINLHSNLAGLALYGRGDRSAFAHWSMKPTLAHELALDALLMTLSRRQPSQPAIVHSDQGSHYGSDDCRGSVVRTDCSRA